jgi:hypothetical protein
MVFDILRLDMIGAIDLTCHSVLQQPGHMVSLVPGMQQT